MSNQPKIAPPRDARGRVLPGHSLNPGGKPKGIEKRLKEYVDSQQEVIDGKLVDGWDYMFAGLYAIATGQKPPGNIDGIITAKDRMAAAQILLDRVYGKAKIQIESDTTVRGGMENLDVDALSADELDALEAHVELLAAKASGKATGKVLDISPVSMSEERVIGIVPDALDEELEE
jgi:hypothetical protein